MRRHGELIEFLVKLLFLGLVFYIAFGVILGVCSVPTESMSPNINFHDTIIYSRSTKDLAIHDVVIYEYGGEIFVGRVEGLPGDNIRFSSDGNLYQNNRLAYEDKIYKTTNTSPECDVTLGANEYFIISDNREYIDDSRTQGAISEDDIMGVSLLVIRRYGI